MAEPEIVIDTGKGRKLTLDELGAILPGMARIMPEVALRIWKLYYAGLAANWPLARFQLKEAINLMEIGSFVRPKYEDNMHKFIEEDAGPVSRAIEAKDVAAFEEAFARMIEQANAYHEVYDKGFLRWKVPETPPPDLDFTPRG
ncbi:MAG: hypothetical protein ACYDAD_07405 [Acidimicrobiales bacterium]